MFFCQGKSHLVRLLRNIVATRITHLTPEALLEDLLNHHRQKQLGPWEDRWNPSTELSSHSFAALLDAETIQAVGSLPGDNEDDLRISYRNRDSTTVDRYIHIEHGHSKLVALRDSIATIFSTPGNTHWATQLDIACLCNHS